MFGYIVSHIQTAELLRKYGARSGASRKVVDDYRGQIKDLDIQRSQSNVSHTVYLLIAEDIDELKTKIKIEKGALRAWSEREASMTTICPRCRGAGKILRPHPESCQECDATGRIAPSLDLLRKSMAMIGPEIKAGDWAAVYVPLITE